MQPRYDICWSRQFIEDVKAIVGDLGTFERAFRGFDFQLSRLPRGPGTWDLNATGDYRLAYMKTHKLEDGTDVPAIYFTFRLKLPEELLLLLRARRANIAELS